MSKPEIPRKLIENPPLFATPEMTCACCHLVRGCKECCARCPAPCNSSHECALKLQRITGVDSSDWWVGVTRVMSDWCWENSVPDHLINKLNRSG